VRAGASSVKFRLFQPTDPARSDVVEPVVCYGVDTNAGGSPAFGETARSEVFHGRVRTSMRRVRTGFPGRPGSDGLPGLRPRTAPRVFPSRGPRGRHSRSPGRLARGMALRSGVPAPGPSSGRSHDGVAPRRHQESFGIDQGPGLSPGCRDGPSLRPRRHRHGIDRQCGDRPCRRLCGFGTACRRSGSGGGAPGQTDPDAQLRCDGRTRRRVVR